MKQYGADILRLWVVIGCDYAEDQRIGDNALKLIADHYRRLRNTFRYLLGALEGWSEAERLDVKEMPELERWVLHRLRSEEHTSELPSLMRNSYAVFCLQKKKKANTHTIKMTVN